MASSASQVLLWLPSEQNLSPIRMRCILQNHSQIEQDPPLQLSLSKFSASARFLQILGSGPLLFQALFPMASSASQVLLWLPSEQNLSPIRMRCILQNHSQIEQDPPLQLSLSKFSASARFLQILGSGPLLFQALFPMASSVSQVLLGPLEELQESLYPMGEQIEKSLFSLTDCHFKTVQIQGL